MAALLVATLAVTPASAATEATTAVHLCGTLREHQAATSTATGRLTIGTRTYTVASGVTAGNGGVEVAIGRDLCIVGSVGDHSGQLQRYTFFWVAPDRRYCGTVRSVTPQDITIASDFGQLRLYRDAAVPSPEQYERICYETVIRTDTGDLAATRKLALEGPGALERKTHCGTIGSYRAATDTADGLIRVGSRQFTIARGTRYAGDPAGDRTDRTTIGEQMCLSATIAPTRDIANPTITVEYATRPMGTNTGGTAYEYRPPSGTAPGIAILSYSSRFELRIPASVETMGDISRGSFCYTVGVDGSGDISATTIIPCSQGSAAGPGPSPVVVASPTATAAPTASPPATTAPATTAPPTTAPAATSPAPVAAVSPPSAADAQQSDGGGASAPVLPIVAGVIGLALVAAYLIARQIGRRRV